MSKSLISLKKGVFCADHSYLGMRPCNYINEWKNHSDTVKKANQML